VLALPQCRHACTEAESMRQRVSYAILLFIVANVVLVLTALTYLSRPVTALLFAGELFLLGLVVLHAALTRDDRNQ
jgi:hypothetical protein